MDSRGPSFPDVKIWQIIVGSALVGTLLVGVWLRWSMTGAVTLTFPFTYLRHAHSHLGYYGLLFPLAWMGWGAAGARIPGRGAILAYAVGTAVAFVGFVQSGYGVIAIAASTFIAGFWLWSAAALRDRLGRLRDPLGMVPLGIVLSLACVPPIAIFLRSKPEVAQGFVSTFLSALLFVVIIPSAFAGRRVSPGPWPVFLLFGVLAALYMGVAPHPVARVGMLAYGGMMLVPAFSRQLDLHVRVPWGLVALGLGGMAVGVLPNIHPVAIGAVHFLILGPVLTTLAPLWLKRAPAKWAWWVGHVAWGSMSGALVAQAFVATVWTWTLAALGGTATLLWWAVVLVMQVMPRGGAAQDG